MTTEELEEAVSVGIGTRARTLLCAAGVAVLAFLLLIPGTADSGHQMDEGAVVAYADRVLDGAAPHRDFLTFYGPGNPWAVAGAFKVFGASVATERGVGMLYQLLLVLSVFVLARKLAGNAGGVAAGIVAALILNGELIWAYSTFGALAAGVGGLALAATAAASRPERRQELLLLGAGAAAGIAVLMRFDLALAMVVSALPLFLYVGSRSRIWYATGFAAVAALYVPHLALVGPEKIERVARDVVASAPGRRLPVPDLLGYPGSLLVAAVAVTAVLVVVGAVLRRELDGRILLAAGLLNAGLLPYTFSRPDAIHIEPIAILPLSLLPALVLMLPIRMPARAAATAALLVATATVVVGATGIGLDRTDPPKHENSGRTFPDGDSNRVESVRPLLARLERDSRAGESLFVGPQDLRRSNYGPTFVYFLVPKLEPASYYMELNPWTANRPGSGLADELRRADWLVLTSDFDNWVEPNESDRLGSTEPNEVVRDFFCQRFESGTYRLYERCDR